jgi:hypothetical protein
MSFVLNSGIGSSTTRDWLEASERMTFTAFAPSSKPDGESEIIEPGKAVDLPAAERARMDRANAGVYTPPERL